MIIYSTLSKGLFTCFKRFLKQAPRVFRLRELFGVREYAANQEVKDSQIRKRKTAKSGSETLTNQEVRSIILSEVINVNGYLPRIADRKLEATLRTSGAVLIVGPKWCGKTRTAEEVAKSTLYMQHPDYAESYLKMASLKPSQLLEGETPRLIDEWQDAPVF